MPVQKTIRLFQDLLYLNILSLILALVIIAGDFGWWHYIRVALGLPFVLFFPGYVLIAALFPKTGDLEGIERVALSFGLSIAVTPLIGLGLNYTPWGIRLAPILVSLLLFIAALSAVTFLRRRKLSPEERYYPVFSFSIPGWTEMSRLDRVLGFILVLAVLFAAGSIYYVVTTPKVGEKFTEFYILGPGGKAEGYPRDLAVGEKGRVIAGIVNHENQPVSYYVAVVMDGLVKQKTGPVLLADKQKWEQPLAFSAAAPYQDMKVQFLLYRAGDKLPYRSLHLWVNITAPAASQLPAGSVVPVKRKNVSRYPVRQRPLSTVPKRAPIRRENTPAGRDGAAAGAGSQKPPPALPPAGSGASTAGNLERITVPAPSGGNLSPAESGGRVAAPAPQPAPAPAAATSNR
ncbi:DUF1616 domain-containing protein [Desulfotomaculum copahuensis]|uniref:DUF1616 domain-containing protein n=1 Tax=Desulfotomaculum copahuensis TaxID=1838280 RepID=A0A1B7LHW9_9FIRM|nr:DUF1616 domain-containing protein [Desulfotomaculum copahuensis]OAT85896.1 hypothetical protein A6M21_05360 [Desulfotomaculum copahuensis]